MKEQLRLEEIKIANPCSEDWDLMEGNEKKKFCLICNKNVHNITGISEKEFQVLVKNNTDGLCVRNEKSEVKKKTGFSFKIWQFLLGFSIFLSGCSKGFSRGTMGEVSIPIKSNTENKAQQTNSKSTDKSKDKSSYVMGDIKSTKFNTENKTQQTNSKSTDKSKDKTSSVKMGAIEETIPPSEPSTTMGRVRSTDLQKNTSTTMGKPLPPAHK